MTTPQLLITALSGIACAGCFLGAGIMLAEAFSKAASRRWWRDRDPLWVEPLSDGAPAQMHGCSALPYQHGRLPCGKAASTEASHPAQQPQGVSSLNDADRTPSELISSLVAGGSLRRVA